MRFNITLIALQLAASIPVALADDDCASLLYDQYYRQKGSLKSFKSFIFSDIHTPIKIVDDKQYLLTQHAELKVCFHLPQAAGNFIKELFMLK
ncbi:hypothetical protein DC498_10605 [Terrimonas sp.]|uniref:hypothetical protein n=1 Tax=Terrimonas sp. TaxID=1914338 RepID=UPI000D513381|nr:hypothetical protein [Terrimonas sp.]PVD52171.1 hypothetical protein DC498_10605 [Terrimonas sp.]